MVRFQTGRDDPSPRNSLRQPPPNYFSRAQQYRLLTLVFTLMFVLFLMGEASKPKNWQWMWQRAVGEPPPLTSNADGADRIHALPWQEDTDERGSHESSEVDTRIPAKKPHPPGVFVSQDHDLVFQDTGAENLPGNVVADSSDDAPGLFPGVRSDELAAIRDDTVFRSAESDTWFRWCELVRDDRRSRDGQGKASSSQQAVTFLQLFRQSDEYRGRSVRVSGVVRRAHHVAARTNEKGVDGYFQCWLFPFNGSNPIVVYALQMPEGFPTGMELYERVSFTGIFFKRWAYQAQGGIMTAPLVLSAAGDWTPPEAVEPMKTPSLLWIVIAIGLAALIGALVAWLVYQQSHAQLTYVRQSREKNLPEKAPSVTPRDTPIGDPRESNGVIDCEGGAPRA